MIMREILGIYLRSKVHKRIFLKLEVEFVRYFLRIICSIGTYRIMINLMSRVGMPWDQN